jgi:4-amino-4-deoxy-L-arabinose transferase
LSTKALGPEPEGFFHVYRLRYLLLTAVLLLTPALGSTPFRRAEIYFADAARAMVERADWLVPYFRGEPFFDKPILTYWFMALPMRIFGPSESTARWTSAAAAILVILVTVWLGQILWRDRRSALVGGCILLTTIPFLTFGRTAMSDMPMTLFIGLSFTAAVAFYSQALSPTAAILLLGAALGLGFLIKGPVAVLIPILGLPYLMWHRRAQRPALSLRALGGSVALFLLLGFGWWAVIYFTLGSGPLEHFFIRENLSRFSGAAHDIGRPFWFYAVTYLGQAAPWSLFLPVAAYHFLRTRADLNSRILLAWILLVGALLSASRGKLDYYLLPLYPPAALLIGRYLCVATWGRAERGLASFALVVAGLASFGLPLAMVQLPDGWRPSGMEFLADTLVLMACGVISAVAAARPAPMRVTTSLAAVLFMLLFVVNVSVLPAFYAGQPNGRLQQAVENERSKQSELAVAARGDPLQFHRELLFESRMVLQETDDLRSLAISGKPYLFLVSADEADSLRLPGIREVGSYSYLPSSALTFRGVFKRITPSTMTLLANFGS